MTALLIAIFVVGYLLITCEHPLHTNKGTFALIMCGLLWAIYATMSGDTDVNAKVLEQLGDTCEILIFLIGAMTIVEVIDRYGVLPISVCWKRHTRRWMWRYCLLARS